MFPTFIVAVTHLLFVFSLNTISFMVRKCYGWFWKCSTSTLEKLASPIQTFFDIYRIAFAALKTVNLTEIKVSLSWTFQYIARVVIPNLLKWSDPSSYCCGCEKILVVSCLSLIRLTLMVAYSNIPSTQ